MRLSRKYHPCNLSLLTYFLFVYKNESRESYNLVVRLVTVNGVIQRNGRTKHIKVILETAFKNAPFTCFIVTFRRIIAPIKSPCARQSPKGLKREKICSGTGACLLLELDELLEQLFVIVVFEKKFETDPEAAFQTGCQDV